MNTFKHHNQEPFETLLKKSKNTFSMTDHESQKLASMFNHKLAQHIIKKRAPRVSPFVQFFTQKMVIASFSITLVISGLLLNYISPLTTLNSLTSAQTVLIENNVALLVKNPLTFSPELRSSLLEAHKAYASELEQEVVDKPEQSLISSTAILGLYQSALSILIADKNTNHELISFINSLVDDTSKRSQEYEEQLAITSLIENDSPSTRDYSQIINAIEHKIEQSQAILTDRPELATADTTYRINNITLRLNNLSSANIKEIKILLKESTDIYEDLALKSVL